MAKGKKTAKRAPKKAAQKQDTAPEKPETGVKSFLSTVGILLVTVVAALIIASIFSSVDTTETEVFDPEDFMFELPTTRTYELTEVDLFSMDGWNSYDVTVKGIALGDTLDQVEATLGAPDDVEIFNPVVTTLIYQEEGAAAVLYYVANKQVRRIFVKPAFNDHLTGSTKINYTLRQIYDTFGVPEEQEEVYKQRIFEYHDKGLEVYNRNKQMTAFALVPPGYNGGQDEERPLSDFA